MDHPCHKCGEAVEDGVPFCSHCEAPQIRVLLPEPLPVPAYSADASSSQAAVILPGSLTASGISLPFSWSRALRPCALATLVAILLVGLRLYPPVAMFGAGILAVAFYRQRNPGSAITPGAGARLGAISGLLWFGMTAALGALVAALGKGSELKDEVIKRMDQAGAGTTDPQVLSTLDYLKTPGGFALIIVLSLVAALFASIVLGALGGAVGGAILGRRNRR